jgi:hypothetical protein
VLEHRDSYKAAEYSAQGLQNHNNRSPNLKETLVLEEIIQDPKIDFISHVFCNELTVAVKMSS